MMVLKRKQIVVLSLILMIVVAGYYSTATITAVRQEMIRMTYP